MREPGEPDGVLSDASNDTPRESSGVSDVYCGLRRSAFKATQRLANVNAAQLPATIHELLADIGRRIGTDDLHFFRIQLDKSGTGFAGLKYQSRVTVNEKCHQLLSRFQFQLFSSEIQNCLRQDQIAVLKKNAGSGGRILTALLKPLECDSYILCPLRVDGELKGAIGIACPRVEHGCTGREFFELLKLNGVILLTHILRVRRERRRSRRLRDWRRIADQSCDFAFSVDERGFIFSTTSFGMGNATPQLDGLRLIDVVARSFQANVQNQISKAVASGRVRTCDFQLFLGSGGPRWYLARIEPASSTPDVHATLYLTDNNPDKILEEEVRELNDQLLKASRLSLLGQMSTEFAHQLNQPLQVMLNYCSTAQRRIQRRTATTDMTLQALTNIEASVMHAADIINRVRDFVKFRSLRTEAVHLDEVIERATFMVLPTARGRDADLHPPNAPSGLTVVVDKAQTIHVLVNLMINALEACSEHRRRRPLIQVSCHADTVRNRAVVMVKDNGPGLPEDDPDIVFRKFYTGKEEGLGMGLAISRSVCESQNGSLSARNNEAEDGCTFFVTMVLYGNADVDTTEIETMPTRSIPID